MRVALLTTFKADKKEPVAILLERIHTAFRASGLEEPAVQFSFSDAPVPGFVSSVDRVLKRYPDLTRFVSATPELPGGHSVRQISNPAGEPVVFSALLAVAGGVPRSFPFHNVSVHFRSPAFGTLPPCPGLVLGETPGILVRDSWWVNGRQRSLLALTAFDADPTSKKLPSPPGPVAAVLAACGKASRTVQIPLVGIPPASAPAAEPNPEVARAVTAIAQDYRATLGEAMDRAALPHDLPPAAEASTANSPDATTGPKKPNLARAFKPLGYDCCAGAGTFTLRRRTAGNLTVEVNLDVGTWSKRISAGYHLRGPGFSVRLPLPVCRRAMGSGQYPIGGPERWRQIVENLAALVAEYDRGIVPQVEAAAGPAPQWYRPES